MYDSSFGWRFVNNKMKELYGVDGMGVTAENLEMYISREDQDLFMYNLQMKFHAQFGSKRRNCFYKILKEKKIYNFQ